MRIAAFCVAVVFLAGCGAKREESQRRQEHAKTATVERIRTERSTLAADGTPFVEVTMTTRTLEQVTQSQADTLITSETTLRVPEISAAVALVAGAGGVTPWGPLAGLAGLVVTALTGAYAANQSAKAGAERKRAEEHKADANEGWARALPTPPQS